jgi:hypothetical protein
MCKKIRTRLGHAWAPLNYYHKKERRKHSYVAGKAGAYSAKFRVTALKALGHVVRLESIYQSCHRYLTPLHVVIGTLRKTGFEQIEMYTMKGRYNFPPSSRRKKWEMFKVITKFWQTSERNVRQFVSRRFPHYFWIFTAFIPFPSPQPLLTAFSPFPPPSPFPHPLLTSFSPFPSSPT